MRRSRTAHCLVAVLIVAAALVGDAVASGPVSAQSGAAPTFSDDPFYTDVPAESDSYEPEGDSGELGWTGPVDPQSESYRHIQSLARAGVFGGTDCGVGRFCPDAHVQRWQVAVWLMRSLGESDLDRIDDSRFADVDADEWWAPHVERMAELGVYTGCSQSPAKYCPESSVNRGHMAIWLARGFELPNPGQYGFTDIGGSNAHNADRVVAAKITTACNQEPLKFCAGTGVTKAQMAVFIFRALDWRQLNTIAESSRVPDDIFLTDYNEFSWYIKTQVVDRYGDDQPWLRAAWNVTNRSTFDYKYSSYYSTSVHYGGAAPQGGRVHTVARAMTTRPGMFHSVYHNTLTHELAHVYTLSNRVSETPVALAAAHLYFSELGQARCGSHELLADTAEHLQFYSKSDNYWGACPHLPYVATSEAITVVREAFQGQIPRWFYDTFQDSGGNLDYEAIWEAVRGMADRRSRRVAVYQLQNSFGGYCASHQVNEFLGGNRNLDIVQSWVLDAGQPWVDGGCDGTAAAPDGEPDADPVAAGATASVRIVARKLAGGRIEFGLQQRGPDDAWDERRLPAVRFFPPTARLGRWLASSPLELAVGEVRIVARKLANGKVEFGLRQRNPDDTWSDNRLPGVRYFPTTARVDRWLVSSPLTLTTPQPTA